MKKKEIWSAKYNMKKTVENERENNQIAKKSERRRKLIINDEISAAESSYRRNMPLCSEKEMKALTKKKIV